MTAPPPFDSFSQNGEDVVLHRALGHIESGRYIDVGAGDPKMDSVSMAFYERGWSGITIEPDPTFAQLQRDERPRDLLVEAAATAKDGEMLTFHLVETRGLSTADEKLATQYEQSGLEVRRIDVTTRRVDRILEDAGWQGEDIHFMSVDTEGSERAVLEGIDFQVWRPWVLVIEATAPNSTESTRQQWDAVVTSAGYKFCLFDGLSCFYVADEYFDDLGPALSYPACTLDHYTTWTFREVVEQREALKPLINQVVHWRTEAISRWAKAVSDEMTIDRLQTELTSAGERIASMFNHHQLLEGEVVGLRYRLDDMERSTSWRISKPVRVISLLLRRLRGRR